MTESFEHIPVLLNEVLASLSPKEGEIFVDCTLGGAGHSVEIAKRLGRSGTLIGIDQDCVAREYATSRLMSLDEETRPKIFVMPANFSELDAVLTSIPVPGIDCILFDLGVSSVQLDVLERGFSYHEGAPLDMRMNTEDAGIKAEDIVNTWDEKSLERIFRVYGEEKFSHQIAKNICKTREVSKITTSDELVEIIKESIPAAKRRSGGHPAKRTFQALRIAVNDELKCLETALDSAIRWLNPGGRICVISYHSLEDKRVKNAFREYEDRCTCGPEVPVCVCGKKPILKSKPRGTILPSQTEIDRNPRARSAKLRCAHKLNN